MKLLYVTITLLCMLLAPLAMPAQEPEKSPLNPLTQPQFVNPLPLPAVIDARAGGKLRLVVTQDQQDLGLVDPAGGNKHLLTKVWGYGKSGEKGTYPGPTILAQRDQALDVTWENHLTSGGKPLPHLLPIDPTVHWALQEEKDWQDLGVPIVTHLHGGHTESASDGLSEAWFTPDFKLKGNNFVKKELHYTNDQEAATLWYHDHALGITRLNVYAGLAGFYILTDANEKKLQEENKLPNGPYDIGLAIQDRMFTTDGQLYFPSFPENLGAPNPSVAPEFFGDFILVNGKTWPVLEVEPRPYRFRILNGSDSRYYNLFLSSGPSIIQIGGDGGLLPVPVSISQLLIGTGERKDVVIDFSNYSGQTLILRNNAKTPYPKGAAVNPQTSGRIMAFKVTKPLDTKIFKAVLPTSLRPTLTALRPTTPNGPRKLILFESTDEYGRLKPMLGTMEKGVLGWHDAITENPMLNSTEVWEIYNQTMDAHTIHLHLVQMQLIDRQKFKAAVDMETGKPSNVRLIGSPRLPGPDEKGWKDTYVMLPGEVTRVIATFDLEGLYTWHCHILSHEDHEMMRPYYVGNMDGGPMMTKAAAATPLLEKELQLQALPNPFNSNLVLQMNLLQPAQVTINIYDGKGGLLQQVYQGWQEAGLRQFTLNGSNWSNGTYFAEVIVNNQRLTRKLVLQK